MFRAFDYRILPLAALLVAGPANDAAAAAITSVSSGGIVGIGRERGVTRLVCERREQKVSARVRAVVLDLGIPEPTREVLLAPSHVLPGDEREITNDCRIDGTGGAPVLIERYWLAQPDASGLSADWVVVMTRSALAQPVGRLRVAVLPGSVLDGLIADDRAVQVMLATPVADQRGCRLLGLREPSVFYHSCRAWAGISGAPIIVGIDDEPVVIGFDIAKRMRPRDMRGPLFIGVGLAINDAIATAIREAADAAREPYQTRR